MSFRGALLYIKVLTSVYYNLPLRLPPASRKENNEERK
nr:MAG TPA: hypothetical protein [Bacteriophage sp.]